PRLDSYQGLAISCGMNPRFGDFDTYHMAASAIDEALRNCVAVGADPDRIAILDNFCWGSTDRPETLGSLVRAAIACHDLAIALKTPFISGKDSLNNEFRYEKSDGTQETIAIPSSLLISAMGQVADVRRCVTMDLKAPGNRLYLVGLTRNELGGSHFSLVKQLTGGDVPRVDATVASATFRQLHQAIQGGLVRACHDLSEGGLAVAIAEMAFAGGWGATLWLDGVPMDEVASGQQNLVALFAESNTRFLCEVPDAHAAAFEKAFDDLPLGLVGRVTDRPQLLIYANMSAATQQSSPVLQAQLADLKEAWQKPLRW
ncbi:MAG: phosphoribosylformylglycinamidine synthase, partial [Planctomycetales bacterium]|nr:phosphoribosylformylglycinamidine synthase [Planctomycetales bacterium]